MCYKIVSAIKKWKKGEQRKGSDNLDVGCNFKQRGYGKSEG